MNFSDKLYDIALKLQIYAAEIELPWMNQI